MTGNGFIMLGKTILNVSQIAALHRFCDGNVTAHLITGTKLAEIVRLTEKEFEDLRDRLIGGGSVIPLRGVIGENALPGRVETHAPLSEEYVFKYNG